MSADEALSDPDFTRDTSPEAARVFYEIQRNRPSADKLRDIFDLSEGLFEAVKAGVRRQYPAADEREVFLRSAATRLPRELMIKVYGWDPQIGE